MMPAHEKRVLSLDGLRGLGALMVFLYHVDIMVKPFGAGGPSLFPGTASVMVFFILSGIVLSLVPFKHMGNGGYDWLGYYPRRVVRLCGPLFAAIALALPAGYVAWRLGSTSRSALAVAYDAGLPTAVHDILMQFDVLFAACLVVVVVAIADGFTRRALSAAPHGLFGKGVVQPLPYPRHCHRCARCPAAQARDCRPARDCRGLAARKHARLRCVLAHNRGSQHEPVALAGIVRA